MMSKSAVCLALTAPMAVLLHGCGGDGTTTLAPTTPSPSPSSTPSSTPHSTPSTTTSTTTTWPAPSPPAPTPGPPTPWDPATAVQQLNAMYMGFDENNDESSLGVTMSMAGNTASFNSNLFCAPLMGTSCHLGEADCRMSAAIFNHKVLVSANRFAPTMDRSVGYVFNQDLTENFFGKCSYLFDGNNFNDLNGGCGAGQAGTCNDTLSAFTNQCSHDSAPHTCTRDDFEIKSRMCKCEPPMCSEAYGSAAPPQTAAGATCFYEMPALIGAEGGTQTSHLRDTLKQRVALQANDPTLESEHNEVVIDNHLLIPKMRSNPTNTILAFVCVPSANPAACQQATQMRDEFLKSYRVTGPGVPVVAIDTTLDLTTSGGPFVLPPQEDLIIA